MYHDEDLHALYVHSGYYVAPPSAGRPVATPPAGG